MEIQKKLRYLAKKAGSLHSDVGVGLIIGSGFKRYFLGSQVPESMNRFRILAIGYLHENADNTSNSSAFFRVFSVFRVRLF
jgi:hypothetical protein